MEPGENADQKRSDPDDSDVGNRKFLGFVTYYSYSRVLTVCSDQFYSACNALFRICRWIGPS